MGDWVIDEESASQTVQTASTSADEYETISTYATTCKDDLLASLEKSDFVYAAFGAWMENCGSLGLDSVQMMTNIAIQGTADAITSYHDGNLEMAATTQSTAANADFPQEMPKADGSANPAPRKEK